MHAAANRAIRVGRASTLAPTGLLQALDRLAREAEEEAAMDAEGILEQAEEANALDTVG